MSTGLGCRSPSTDSKFRSKRLRRISRHRTARLGRMKAVKKRARSRTRRCTSRPCRRHTGGMRRSWSSSFECWTTKMWPSKSWRGFGSLWRTMCLVDPQKTTSRLARTSTKLLGSRTWRSTSRRIFTDEIAKSRRSHLLKTTLQGKQNGDVEGAKRRMCPPRRPHGGPRLQLARPPLGKLAKRTRHQPRCLQRDPAARMTLQIPRRLGLPWSVCGRTLCHLRPRRKVLEWCRRRDHQLRVPRRRSHLRCSQRPIGLHRQGRLLC
mmetsp:Transcript_25384/g.66479  ORF Transcript_25384/g.66479 Transcript_25384/m.66479 type:complete len:264 (+) Transcript_25384:424-1215(+)